MTTVGTRSDDVWRLLELVSVAEPGSAEAAEAVQLCRSGVDQDQLLALAVRHTLVPLLTDFLTEHDQLRTLDTHPLANAVAVQHMNAYRTAVFAGEADRVVSALRAAGITVACTKGVVCQAICYGDRGSRWLSDLDIMVDPADARSTAQVFEQMGYRSGVRYDLKRGELVPLDRDLRAVYRLYPDHLPPFFRLTGDLAFPVVSVDTAFSITWYNSRWQPPMREVLARLDEVPVRSTDGTVTLPTLTMPYAFLFLITHLFRESWFLRTVGVVKSARLCQFADIARWWRRLDPPDRAVVADVVRRHDLGPVVGWIGHHVDALFGTTVVAGLDLGDFTDERWVASACGTGGTWLGWHGDMRRRLRSGSSLELWPVPEPPYAAAATERAEEPERAATP